MQRRPEDVAAVTNGLIVLLAPVAVFVIMGLTFSPDAVSDGSTSVVARDPDRAAVLASIVGTLLFTLTTFAAIAAWRTHVHARRWLEKGDRAWRGVVEAGLVGFGVALVVLGRGIVTRPLEAPPYVIVYGGAAMLAGLIVGLVLRFTALLVLRSRGRPALH